MTFQENLKRGTTGQEIEGDIDEFCIIVSGLGSRRSIMLGSALIG